MSGMQRFPHRRPATSLRTAPVQDGDVRQSIFEYAGGAPAFLALARAHHARCLADPELEHPFSHGTHPEHVERLAAYWAEVLGGPTTYSQKVGDQSSLVGDALRQR